MTQRFQIKVNGVVQGVGFRPFVFRLARELQLKGFICNTTSGALIEAEGDKNTLHIFTKRIRDEKPHHAIIKNLDITVLNTNGYDKFEIIESLSGNIIDTIPLPDIAICDDCLRELLNPSDRRYNYPFINCTNCGPRYSIIKKIPYDRCNTSMKDFLMCDECKAEYNDKNSRRFHAQPIACPQCGPQIRLIDNTGKVIADEHSAIHKAVKLLTEGKIIALKGLGGFQLLADAFNRETIVNLRKRKHRERKPFAMMFPDIESVKKNYFVSEAEENLLISSSAPIVLLKKNNNNYISDDVAPLNPNHGVMLPYTPLHFLLMKEIGRPVIATSGNISEEPICIDNDEAFNKLNNIADYFLIHNRPIVRPVDDSIVRVIDNQQMILRRARGYSPLPITLDFINNFKTVTLAVGGHLKNTISVKKNNDVFISQHLGDLSTFESFENFKKTISDFKTLFNIDINEIISDEHPDYQSSKYALSLGIEHKKVQHHVAHIASSVAENNINGKCLGVAWDGTGYSLDGIIYGSEFFFVDDTFNFRHLAHFKPFLLPGGDETSKDTKRCAIGVLFDIFKDDLINQDIELINDYPKENLINLLRILNKRINCLQTTSAGRIFDALSAILGLCHYSHFEGEAAMALEFISDENENGIYPFYISGTEFLQIEWRKIIINILDDIKHFIPKEIISAKFHNTLVEVIYSLVKYSDTQQLVLSGGCFQNKYLLERVIRKMRKNKIDVFWNKIVPINDGGISFGQIAYNELLKRKVKTGI